MKKILLLVYIGLLIYGCKKQDVNILRTYRPEKVDMILLNEYIDYSMAVERKALWNKSITIHPTLEEFNRMIDNFLVNDRINLRHRLSMITPTNDPVNGGCFDGDSEIPIPCPNGNPTGINNSISCTGSFQDYNTVNTVLFTATLNSYNTEITSDAFAFGGVSGTWTVIGPINQQLYDGTITYKQYYQESYAIPYSGGLVENQLYLLYGSIQGGTCTVYGMQVPKPVSN